MKRPIYEFSRYREAFAELFRTHRETRPGWLLIVLAERIRVQPSHFSNVIKERSHFSSDQIHAICAELGLTEEETSYLDLLMEWERAEFPPRKQALLDSIQKIRDQRLRVDKELKFKQQPFTPQQSEAYYLDPNVELIHLYLQTKDARHDASDIARVWGLSPAYVAGILQFLQAAQLIELRRKRWQVKPVHQHLAASSPLAKPAQTLRRMKCIEALQKVSPEKVYSFSGTLTMSEETKLSIQARFVEFLKSVEKDVVKSPAEKMFYMQFDLFPWLDP